MASWAKPWVAMWAVFTAALLGAAFFLPFAYWAGATVVLFGVPEFIGVRHRGDRFPPLTYVVRRYVPRWVVDTVVWGFAGAAGGSWFGFAHPWRVGALFALVGWLTNHFDVTYDGPGE